MATDKLMNHSQGESIITNLGTIATNLQNVTAISPAKFGMGYAVCDTAAGTAAKTSNIANYVLTEGALVTVKFTNANTASNATLNLNNTGAKPILYKGSALTTDIISAGDICTFIYSTANSGSYNIINVDALSGAGAGTVKSVGAEGGLTTDQTSGAAISTTGNVKLNLKSNTAFTATAPDPVEIENKIYPVALDKDGHPAVSVPGTTYTEGTGIDITNNVITNAGVTAVTASDSSTGTNGTISVTTNGTTDEVAVKGLSAAAYKGVATSIPASGADDTKVATEKAVADSISGKAIGTNSSTTNAIATFAGTDGKTLSDSAVTIAKNATGVTDDDTKVPTSKAVKTYVDATATGISRYIGTITAANQLSTTAKKGDFYIVSTAWTGVHTGDEIIAEKDNPTATIDGTNWTLLHNEADTNTTYTFAEGTTNGKFTVTPSDTGTAQSVTVHGLAASAYKGVDTTPTASSPNLVESGGVASALSGKQATLTFDGTYNASTNKAATVSTVTNAIGALDVSEVSVGSTKTINKISQTDGKISVSTTDIRSASTSQTGIVQLNDAINNTSTTQAATANAVKKVNDKVETNLTNILYALNTGVKNRLPSVSVEDLKKINTGGTWSGNVYTYLTRTYTVNDDLSITVKGGASGSSGYDRFNLGNIIANTGDILSGTPSGYSTNAFIYTQGGNTYNYGSDATFDAGDVGISRNITIAISTTYALPSDGITFYPMVRPVGTDSTYIRPALPNYDLTRLEAEDRAALAEEIDAGAKNSFDWSKVDLVDRLSVSNGVFTTTCTDTLTNLRFSLNGLNSSKGIVEYFVGNASSGYQVITTNGIYAFQFTMKSNIVYLRFGHNGSQQNGRGDINVQHLTVGETYIFALNITQCSSATSTFKWQDVMICTLADWKVSQKFVPYRYDPYTTVWQNIANATLYARRNGRTVTVNGYVDNVSFTAGAQTYLGTINTTIGKPLQQVRSICSVGANGYTFGEAAYLTIATDGNVAVKPNTYSGTGAVFFSVSYTI